MIDTSIDRVIKREGLYQTWYEDGALAQEYTYVNGEQISEED